ncbi:hypothetical protein TELCIR_11706 [Teladorsagia circumcincta]|uniref:Serpentine receptor class gamma n=1 Tax=Teladorsagia circumcincta TaxID=45464 RepID=A0A2G9U8H4_TELCI|nr:hypothetical protein TELCIR_11706 [Teladorsagia circumcincta]
MESFNSHVVLMLIPYASDVFTLSVPYLVMILNTSVRSRVMSYLGCGCSNSCGKTTVEDLRRSDTSEISPYTNLLVFVNSFYAIQLANVSSEQWWSVIYTGAPEALVRVIWNAVVPLCATISYLSPLIVTHPYLVEEASFLYSSKINGYVATSDSSFPTMYLQLYIFMCVFVVASSGVNIISIVSLCQRSKRIKFARAERSMLTLALLSFLTEIGYFILLTIIQIDRTGNFEKNARYTLIPFTSDLMTFSMPYLISHLFPLYKLNRVKQAIDKFEVVRIHSVVYLYFPGDVVVKKRCCGEECHTITAP